MKILNRSILPFLLGLNRLGYCMAQEEDEGENVFAKDPPTLAPSPGENDGAPLMNLPPPSLSPTPPPTDVELRDDITFVGDDNCKFTRDIFCVNPQKESLELISNMNETEKESWITETFAGELGVSYRPFVSASIDYWGENSTTGWAGFSVEESDLFEVRAMALGVVINSISKIDSIQGVFNADLRLYLYNITDGPFPSITSAVNAIYKDESRTTSKESDNKKYYRLRENELGGAWTGASVDAWVGARTEDQERVHPDGVCTARAMASMKPIPLDDIKKFNLDLVLRLPHANSFIQPELVPDEVS